MAEERPRVRPLDLIPVAAQGGQAFLLRDPQGLSDKEVVLPADLAYLVTQFDGTRTVREAQVSYVRRFGTLLMTDRIQDLLGRLDEALLMDTERFREFRARIEEEFRAQPVRRAAHAGRSYQAEAAAFAAAWQPRLEGASLPGDFRLDSRRPALIAPHYDMGGAAECYAAAYRLLAEAERPEVVVILGITHSGGSAPFALTRKPFETPFGVLEADEQMTGDLIAAAPFDALGDEFLHRDEHSVEFQAALLHFLYREGAPPKLVPILCGSYHRREGKVVSPAGDEAVQGFITRLRELVSADSRRVAVIASADLSHVGARFGDRPPLTQVHLDLARRHDMALLEMTQAGDADGLCEAVGAEQDRYNVCGFPALYALARVSSPAEGRLLAYRQSVEAQTQSCVSFASVGLR